MAMKNRFTKNSKAKIRELIRLFSLNLEAPQIAVLTGLNRNTVNRFLKAPRERIAEDCEFQSLLSGEVEVGKFFLGFRRVKGKRGQGTFGKTIVFGLFKRSGKVYPEIVPSCSKDTLQGIIRGKVALESVTYVFGPLSRLETDAGTVRRSS